MNNNYWFEPTSFIVGIFFALWIAIILIAFTNNIVIQSNEAIKECEKSLPRDQHCIIMAVPNDDTSR